MTNEAMGPSKAVAFDQAGQPTKAAIGFAAGQGVPVESLQVRQTPRGEYLFAVKRGCGTPDQDSSARNPAADCRRTVVSKSDEVE